VSERDEEVSGGPITVNAASWTGNIEMGRSLAETDAAYKAASPEGRMAWIAGGFNLTRLTSSRDAVVKITLGVMLLIVVGVVRLFWSLPAAYAAYGGWVAAERFLLAVLMCMSLPLIVRRLWNYLTQNEAQIQSEHRRRWWRLVTTKPPVR
jgi:hypothetical protein